MEGTPFGRYRLIQLLGRGGMGEVWRAYDTTIDRMVALKMLLPHYTQNPDFEKRFRREARAAARLDDPHIVPIHDVGEIEGRLYVTMRLIDGVNLQTLLDNGPLEPSRAVNIIEQIASALHTAHQAGLVHRDVKPSNILLARNDFAYLIDFGIARAADDTALTATGATIGTWAYMAPERFRAGDVQPAADVYALACVLYECLTGQPPFPGDTLEEIVVGHMVTTPPRPSENITTVPSALDDVIATGLAKQPTDRYPSALDLATAARRAVSPPASINTVSPTAPTQLSTYYSSPPSPDTTRGYRRGVLIGALIAVLLVVAGGVFTAVKLTGRDNPASTGAPAAIPPFTGTYRADFSAPTTMAGAPVEGAKPSMAMWGVRSTCRPDGCVATAERLSGAGLTVSKLVFDQIGGGWLAVALASEQCQGTTVDVWEVFTLQPHPDGSLSGTYTETTSKGCSGRLALTFTRIGDIDVSGLADPTPLPPRVVSPAAALRGRYHQVTTYASGQPQDEYDFAVTTNCLRSGDRCMSYFHSPSISQPLVFTGRQWIWDAEGDGQCPDGAPTHIRQAAQYPLPEPARDPIPLLTGHGHTEQTGSCPLNTDIDQTFTRTGD